MPGLGTPETTSHAPEPAKVLGETPHRNMLTTRMLGPAKARAMRGISPKEGERVDPSGPIRSVALPYAKLRPRPCSVAPVASPSRAGTSIYTSRLRLRDRRKHAHTETTHHAEPRGQQSAHARTGQGDSEFLNA